FKIKLESTKKIENADLVVGVQRPADDQGAGGAGPLVVTRAVDPNVTHPLRMTEVLAAINPLHGRPFTSNAFQAIAWKHKLKDNAQYCWKLTVGAVVRYSPEIVVFIKRLTAGDVELAIEEYKQHNARRT